MKSVQQLLEFVKISGDSEAKVVFNYDQLGDKRAAAVALALNYLKEATLNRDLFFFGYRVTANKFNEEGINDGWLSVDFSKFKDALFIGKKGSGKSTALKSVVLEYVTRNASGVQIVALDPQRGSQRFKNLSQHLPANTLFGGDEIRAKTLIDIISCEVTARTSDFQKQGADNVFEYELKSDARVNRIVFVIEEGDLFFKWLNSDGNAATAKSFYDLLTFGRDLGVYALVALEDAASLSQDMLESFGYVFRFEGEHKGLARISNGWIQFEMLSHSDLVKARGL